MEINEKRLDTAMLNIMSIIEGVSTKERLFILGAMQALIIGAITEEAAEQEESPCRTYSSVLMRNHILRKGKLMRKKNTKSSSPNEFLSWGPPPKHISIKMFVTLVITIIISFINEPTMSMLGLCICIMICIGVDYIKYERNKQENEEVGKEGKESTMGIIWCYSGYIILALAGECLIDSIPPMYKLILPKDYFSFLVGIWAPLIIFHPMMK